MCIFENVRSLRTRVCIKFCLCAMYDYDQFQIGVQQFEFFMSGHMDILANDPSEDEIIQQALLQPSSSEVFVQASAKVHGDRRKSWFYWRYVCTLCE